MIDQCMILKLVMIICKLDFEQCSIKWNGIELSFTMISDLSTGLQHEYHNSLPKINSNEAQHVQKILGAKYKKDDL